MSLRNLRSWDTLCSVTLEDKFRTHLCAWGNDTAYKVLIETWSLTTIWGVDIVVETRVKKNLIALTHLCTTLYPHWRIWRIWRINLDYDGNKKFGVRCDLENLDGLSINWWFYNWSVSKRLDCGI